MDGWIDAATLELTEEDLDEIAGAVEENGAGGGPAGPPPVGGPDEEPPAQEAGN